MFYPIIFEIKTRFPFASAKSSFNRAYYAIFIATDKGVGRASNTSTLINKFFFNSTLDNSSFVYVTFIYRLI